MITKTLLTAIAELHDYMGEEVGRKVGMPLDVFIEEAYNGLAAGSDTIFVGAIGPKDMFNDIVDKRAPFGFVHHRNCRGQSHQYESSVQDGDGKHTLDLSVTD